MSVIRGGSTAEGAWEGSRDFVLRRNFVLQMDEVERGHVMIGGRNNASIVNLRVRRCIDGPILCFGRLGSGAERRYQTRERRGWLLRSGEDGLRTLRSGATFVAQGEMPAALPRAPTLRARFLDAPKSISDSRSGELAFVIENIGSDAVAIDIDHYQSAWRVLNLSDERGRRYAMRLPGIPPTGYTPRKATLLPGQAQRFVVSLDIFADPLPFGRYVVSIDGEDSALESEQIRIDIGYPASH